ncbi:response regulator transcription factor [Haloplanus halobius]|uniref:response regulator transcription factor n=1 Tax=Haloplanus halobius TaxID=2934938 RepID=UPI00200D3D13|nr:response regulator [Haloplanus sp. XH21]
MTDTVTVLIVEDETDLADTYAIWLEQEEYEVWTAYSGDEALSKLEPAIDVILLDRRMPNIPGDVVLKKAREREGAYQISMLTAVEPNADIFDLPFDEYLTKPVTRTEVLDAVERLVVRDSIEDDLNELFQLASKHSTLATQSNDDIERTQRKIQEEIQDQHETIQSKIQRLDDPEDYFSVIEEPPATYDSHDAP